MSGGGLAILWSGRRLIRRRPFSRPAFAVVLGLSGGDADAAFEDKFDVVAGNFRTSIIFRLPAPAFIYYGIVLEFNPFGLFQISLPYLAGLPDLSLGRSRPV